MDNEKKPCCCCGTPAQPEAATAPAVDASAVPTESVTPSCCRHKDRTPEEHKALLNRLSRIEGQVRGIRGMLEKDAYCVDILVQVAAANSALNSFSKELLAQHISTCVADDLRAGSEEKLDEVKTYAAMAYTALNCEGLARCDFFVEKGTGRVLINEINTFPGFTSISMYPKLMEHEGIPVPALIDRLIALALERTEKQHG